MSEDERALRERLAALESEVKAEANAQKARKEAALELVQAERARRAAKAAAVEKAKAAAEKAKADDSDSILEDLAASASKREQARQKERGRGRPGLGGLGDALELAQRTGDLKKELTAPRKKGQKSWMVSAGLSTAFGPLGWLYAGSWREAAPAAAIWALGLYAANWILPFILLMPALMIALPLSGIAGAIYALGYNRAGARQRLFGEDKPKKALGPSSDD